MVICFLGMTLPFVFFKSIYPFYRFGMFAEPAALSTHPKEIFFATYRLSKETCHFSPESVGMPQSQWELLSRNYYYRGESDKFLKTLQTVITSSSDWRLFKIEWKEAGADTLLVFPKTRF